MKALTWHGKGDIRCESVPDPAIEDEGDAIIKVTACAICGSDLHIYNGLIPAMEHGDVIGHETMGEVVALGKAATKLKVGDRVVVPFTIACGECFFCQRGFHSACERTNPDREKAVKMWGNSPAGLFGYSHLLGGYSGGQAEYLRVPHADVGPVKIPEELTDEQVLFLSDIFPTGYMAAEFCDIEPGDTIAVWGCGPVGQMAIRSALLLGAERVIAVDTVPERLRLAESAGAATLDYMKEDIYERIMEMTHGRGADACIDAVGTEADSRASLDSLVDRVKVAAYLGTDRPHVLREAIHCCRNFGTVSIVGVYGGYLDKIPFGSAINRGLTFRMAQTPVQRYLPILLDRIRKGEIDPSFVITHRGSLEEGPDLYQTFNKRADGCVKVVLRP
ncbi:MULTISPECIES: zinc-dependent alcohol dehydrogenase [Sinorhizobium]|uniref:Glutathione-dependent formaldehyde dehydrogenase n=1 Tax=Sinorhizobium americanum TaxID=194963 RepID=A0A2S3YJ20_9HYPH|nr:MULTISPECIES: zinc-dependent alcohol dehydrogenase [Sinorhizobium]ASY58329.1 Threonine dehydrogenase-related Zn-dependent dehydrogenase [Sinorhizobium sp. CCBAU 05631]PDT41167.1 glutathione-dependent formaldehyde dehydrogenase [Sinorhizobium sp. FG01]PDT51741.1 glutathione-dependent formaldehyde dehydrogenase [Sinorhizobium sp. NG07B]POH26992.1 glutathione-dependent formaldehyde dehydrogenase [Sinorhizobium americanum]POH27065.1 glutathione-dependent formaldehyde dehydrogenase [Sinorhizobiu